MLHLRPPKIFPLVLLILLGLLVLFLIFGGFSGENKLSVGERVAFNLTAPASQGAVSGGFSLRKWWQKYFSLVGVAEENIRLRQEILQLEAELARKTENELAYKRLAKLLKITESYDIPYVVAKIVGKPLGSWQRVIIIDRGLKDGVLPEMPVLSYPALKNKVSFHALGALVGQVVAVEDHYAKVMLLLDPSSAVDVLVQRSRQRGILRGKGQPLCLLDYVPAEADIRENDVIITSGFDGLYPKGILVGWVSTIYPGRLKGLFRPIEVQPAVDFSSLEEVLVLLRKPIR